MSAKSTASVIRRIAIVNVVFCLGIAFTLANYHQLNGMATMAQNIWKMRKKTGTGDWFFTRYAAKGVLRHDPSRSHEGYTLYTVMSEMTVFLVDMSGRIVHRWEVPMGYTDRSLTTFFGVMQPHIDAAEMLPNGDVLVVYSQPSVGPYGSTVTRLDMHGNVLWRHQVGAHHSMKFVDGKIYTLTGTLHDSEMNHPLSKLSRMSYLDDQVTVFDESGRELEVHSVVEMMVNSDLRLNEILSVNSHGDPLHANDIEVLTEKTAGFIPNAKPGDVLLSLRHINTVALADLTANKITWVLRGTFRQQHDIDVLGNGNVMLFDNEGDITDTGKSRTMEINPRTGAIVWEYGGTQMDGMYSENRGSQQRLPNGNTLINESNAGRIFEVAPNGDVVWEYVHPIRAVEDGKSITATVGLDVVRYDMSFPEFLKSEVRREAAR